MCSKQGKWVRRIISQEGEIRLGNRGLEVEERGTNSSYLANAPPAITKPKGKPLHV